MHKANIKRQSWALTRQKDSGGRQPKGKKVAELFLEIGLGTHLGLYVTVGSLLLYKRDSDIREDPFSGESDRY
jgi:hypothetical protein